MVDLEDRNRRNNLRLISLKEGAEGSDTIDFLTKSLTAKLYCKQPGRTLLVVARELTFCSDYSNFTAQSRRAFSHSIAFVRSHGLQTFLLFPAALKVHSLSPASADRTHSDGMKKVGSAVQHLSQSLSWHLDLFTR
ncbi:UNVERIFIED_CONTAM: hypothetical protein FKN15_021459 [Acipenser sinensis]